ncbi:hypothetical protein FN846DRAFT_973662 [Sphaerosporella brunnea]|uniref:Large ribosomal subunit protein mL53 n=1 Tax=Sphaerosporella brunnea TaxID=1250544 RepID=A0A5J5EGW3_9PEZI|nr:hypothetical protein FN846DRAFT_973662 [Sphaerosporella brunnea]
MITRYLASAKISFDPFSRGGKTARIFAALLPPDARATGMKVATVVLDRQRRAAAAPAPAGVVELVFKDGRELRLDTTRMSVADVVEEVDRHSRGLARREELAG